MKYVYASLGVVGFTALLGLAMLAMEWIAAHVVAMWITVVGGTGVMVYMAFRAFLDMFDPKSSNESSNEAVND